MNRNSIVGVVCACVLAIAGGTLASAALPKNQDLTVAPEKASALHLHFDGAKMIASDPAGGLVIVKGDGRLMHYRPEAYQIINGEVRAVTVRFRIDDLDHATAEFGAIDKSAPVVLKQGAVMANPS